jgi:hypothetical protein
MSGTVNVNALAFSTTAITPAEDWRVTAVTRELRPRDGNASICGMEDVLDVRPASTRASKTDSDAAADALDACQFGIPPASPQPAVSL